MGGLKKYMPITFATMLMGWLAICGIPIWAGFFSKDEILWKTWSARILGVGSTALPGGAAKALWFIGAVTALLTAVYMTRLMVMTFWGTERFREMAASGHADQGDAHAASSLHESAAHVHSVNEPHESSWLMTAPLVVLAVLSTFGGLVGVSYALGSLVSGHPTNYLERTLDPILSSHPSEPGAEEVHWLSPPPQPIDGAPAASFAGGSQDEETIPGAAEVQEERLLALTSVLIALTGVGLGFLIYRKRPLLAMPSLLEHKYYIDEIYDAMIIHPIEEGSREGLWKLFDQEVIDGSLHALGRAVTEAGGVVRYLQIGFVRSYAAIILVGALALIGIFSYFGYLVRLH